MEMLSTQLRAVPRRLRGEARGGASRSLICITPWAGARKSQLHDLGRGLGCPLGRGVLELGKNEG